jgi:hypothetical protein
MPKTPCAMAPAATTKDPVILPRELEKDVPPPSGNYTEPKPDPLGGPANPKQVTQPISASLW